MADFEQYRNDVPIFIVASPTPEPSTVAWYFNENLKELADYIGNGGVNGIVPSTLTDQATITTDCNLNNRFKVTLAGNRTLGKPTNAVDGAAYTWWFKQGAGGNHTLTLNAAFVLPVGASTPTLSTAAGAVDILSALYDAVADKFRVVAFLKYTS
jgi:hypothetical protein